MSANVSSHVTTLVDISSSDQIDYLYSVMVKSLVKFSDKYIPKTKFRHFLKPYWNSELTTLHKDMTALRKVWVDCFKPLDSSPVYKQKLAKCTFRRCHRQTVDN